MKSLLYTLAFICFSLLSCSSNVPTEMNLDSIKTEQSRLNSSLDSLKKQIVSLESKNDILEKKLIKLSEEKQNPESLLQYLLIVGLCFVIPGVFFLINWCHSSKIKENVLETLNDRIGRRLKKEDVENLINEAIRHSVSTSNKNDKYKPQINSNIANQIEELGRKVEKIEKDLAKENLNQNQQYHPSNQVSENKQVPGKVGYFGCSIHSGLFKGVFEAFDPDKCFFKVNFKGDKGEFDIIDIKKLKSKDWFDSSIAETKGVQLSEAISSKTIQKGIVEKSSSEGIWKVISPIKIELFNK